MKLKFIDLFAGIGGIRRAFENEGFECIRSVENNKKCCKTFEANFKESPEGDVTKIIAEDLPSFDLLVAGFPCQPFSMLGDRKGFCDEVRGTLFFDICRILKAKQPKAFMLENVKGLVSHDNGRTFDTIIDKLRHELHYEVRFRVLDAKDFGVPQKRKRIFIVGFKDDRTCDEFEFPEPPCKPVKLGDILEKDVPLDYYVSQIYMDGLEKHKKNQEKEGRGFGYQMIEKDGCANALVCCANGRERNLIVDENVPSGYGQSDKNKKKIRMVTLKECARLQGFPEDFKIPENKADAYRQFGNSVAIPVVQAVAKQIKVALKVAEKKEKTRNKSCKA